MKKGIVFLVCLIGFLFIACPNPPKEKVWVKVCNSFPDTPSSETRIANEFCPATHDAQYLKSDAPQIFCSLHKKEEIPVTTLSWPETHFLLASNYTYYSGLVLTPEVLDETKLFQVYDAQARKGLPNAFREFAFIACEEWRGKYLEPFLQTEGKYDLTKANEDYWNQVVRRLDASALRKLTAIVSLVDNCSTYANSTWNVNPFNGKLNVNGTTEYAQNFYTDDKTIEAFLSFVETFVNRTKHLLPYIIFETANEGGNYDWHKRIIAKLRSLGIPVENIQIEWWDSSEYWSVLSETLEKKGLAGTHCIGSNRSVDWYRGGAKHDYLLPAGDYPSSDGPDFYGEAEGLKGKNWPDEAKRPSNSQIRYIVGTMKELNGRGFEHLSAIPMLNSDLPALDDVLGQVGADEMQAFVDGYSGAMKLRAERVTVPSAPFSSPHAPSTVLFKSISSLRGKK